MESPTPFSLNLLPKGNLYESIIRIRRITCSSHCSAASVRLGTTRRRKKRHRQAACRSVKFTAARRARAFARPVDLRGLPFLGSDGRSRWATPEFLPQNGSGILFLDELNAAPAMVQASCYQLVLDRKLGEYTLPEGWAIIAAGNRDSDRGVTTRMPTPLRNRFVHLEFEVDMQDWSEWAIQAGIRPEVIAFLRFRPELISAFDRDAHAFPSPRSWEFVSHILDSLNSQPNPAIEHEVIAGAVGTGAATEFSALPQNVQGIAQHRRHLAEPAPGAGPGERGRTVCGGFRVGAVRLRH